MLGDSSFNVSALKALINLFGYSSEARLAALEVDAVERILDLIRNDREMVELAIMALVNITLEEPAALVLLQTETKLKGLYLRRLILHWK
jgi:hypothetical protein